MLTGLVVQTTGKKHIVMYDNVRYECTLKGKIRMKGIKSTNPVAVGDYVDFEIITEHTGVITNIKERKNCILRKSSNLSKATHIIASNIDQVVIVYTLKSPETSTVFLDRLLVASESYNIKPFIVFNKADLYNRNDKSKISELMNIYNDIGYKNIQCSLTEQSNTDELKNEIKNKVNVVVGHSGAGKSTLINTIEPGINLKTGKISEYHKSGRHITTYAKMIELSIGGYIIDTPGIRGFGIVDIKKEEIYHFFPEIFKTSQKCHFYNCTHIHEPNCAVISAIENGDISFLRYKSYLNMISDADDKHRQKDVGII